MCFVSLGTNIKIRKVIDYVASGILENVDSLSQGIMFCKSWK